eukprot:831290-Amphidinium_carterae.1
MLFSHRPSVSKVRRSGGSTPLRPRSKTNANSFSSPLALVILLRDSGSAPCNDGTYILNKTIPTNESWQLVVLVVPSVRNLRAETFHGLLLSVLAFMEQAGCHEYEHCLLHVVKERSRQGSSKQVVTKESFLKLAARQERDGAFKVVLVHHEGS